MILPQLLTLLNHKPLRTEQREPSIEQREPSNGLRDMKRVILHVDMDAFFAAIEQREHPDFFGKPLIVGADPKKGKGRGVVNLTGI
jgi:hypothetical protein